MRVRIRRRLTESLAKVLMVVSLALVFLGLFAVLAVVIWKGARALTLSMLIELPKGGYYLGKGGGIANAILGSLLLAGGATLISMLFAFPVALSLQREYSRSAAARFTRLALDFLWGIPSIVFGAVGFVVMVLLGLRASLLGGLIVLSLLMLPVMARAADEVIRLVPIELKEAAYTLGATRLQTTRAVLLRQTLPGLVTAVMLAFGRGIGDAASILFTAGYTDGLPRSLLDPVASLPLAVFFQIATPVPEVQDRAYAAALVLLFIVLLVNTIARLLALRFSRHTVR